MPKRQSKWKRSSIKKFVIYRNDRLKARFERPYFEGSRIFRQGDLYDKIKRSFTFLLSRFLNEVPSSLIFVECRKMNRNSLHFFPIIVEKILITFPISIGFYDYKEISRTVHFSFHQWIETWARPCSRFSSLNTHYVLPFRSYSMISFIPNKSFWVI